ncbi:hypothetical protein H103_02565 [Trichophyton rubrum CBS 288.86]|uniref:Uncharacterized protein n=1 Tax=Trichophyton rubrum CBS 288.86 TaxID=1215330 RepID=A0A022W8R2_TRIRU|nr:hypothetical protein H100_02559 [Trichophyton rubrum MR850]EZF54737.1 hypothetical protein H103_02565 [Trichophyton rubrum CBS 288.86]EZG18987.1 hypothetical protein H107_02635 [Trichophyton rubrum CBS 202.88]
MAFTKQQGRKGNGGQNCELWQDSKSTEISTGRVHLELDKYTYTSVPAEDLRIRGKLWPKNSFKSGLKQGERELLRRKKGIQRAHNCRYSPLAVQRRGRICSGRDEHLIAAQHKIDNNAAGDGMVETAAAMLAYFGSRIEE